MIIHDHKLNNLKDEYSPIKDEYDVTIEGKCEEVGNEIYFNTFFYEGIKENPFKLEERVYPVEYGTSFKSTYTLMLKIPDNYTIVQKPSDITLKTPDNGTLFMYQVTQNGNNIIINSKFNITKTTFYITDYPYLKEFYDRVVKKNNEPIILKKIK